VAAVLAVASLMVNLVLMLSDRVPGVLGRLPDRIDAGEGNVSRAVSEVRLPESDAEIHVVVWAITMLLVGLVAWSWRSLAIGVALVLVLSTLVELAQSHVTLTRNTQFGDVVANVVGVSLGLAVAVVLRLAWSRLRRLAERR
jgi:hypothetical protein